MGVGGLGSFVALELAHLGIGHLILIDPDRVEETNLNRLLGIGSGSIGQLKVEAYRQLIQRISPDDAGNRTAGVVYSETGVYYAKAADILFGCVDNHGARLILNQIAARYLIPYIDAGTGIKLPAATRNRLAGWRTSPGYPARGRLFGMPGCN